MRKKQVVQGISLLMLISLLLWGLSCAVNPVTGKREFMLLSEAEEIALGQQSDGQVVSSYGVYNDAKITKFVADLGNRMVPVSHRPNLKYEFKVLDSPVINAFAVPGGYVYITRGILAYMNNEAEFAGVMGHEIGHITARHSAKQYSRAQLATLGLGLGSAVSENFAQLAGLAQTSLGLIFLRFGRDAERESDRLGVEYSTRIGYDSREMANFFQTLDRMSPSDQGGLPGWFSTHPSPSERVGNIRSLSTQWQQDLNKNPSSLKVNRDGFLTMLEGMIYGEDPKNGYIEGNMFYHPEMKFQFGFPANWKAVNSASQVQVVSDDEKAAVILSLASGSIAAVSSKFLTDSKATVIRSSDNAVNGFPAKQVISDIASQQGALRVVSYFIQYNNNIYVFHGFSSQQTFSTYQAKLESVMKNFRKLTDPAKINVKPDRIRIKTVSRQMSARDALLSLGVADKDLENIALMNGMLLTDVVPAGTKVKTVGK